MMSSHETTDYPISEDGPSKMDHFIPPQREGTVTKRAQSHAMIDRLPDYPLLEIFDHYREDSEDSEDPLPFVWDWKTLADVCQSWRTLIIASPQRLHVRVICRPRTPVRASLDIWPPFLPIAVISFPYDPIDEKGEENLIAALEHRDRISEIHIYDEKGKSVERLVVGMQKPFPALTSFYLGSFYGTAPILPKAFLGGSVPCLREFTLDLVKLSSFPEFALKATYLVTLRLIIDILDPGYVSFSPGDMATCLAALPKLKSLTIQFLFSPSRSYHITTFPQEMPLVLPTLEHFQFRGISEYLENLVSRVSAPLLTQLSIVLFKDIIFDIPELHKFITRAEKVTPLDHAQLFFDDTMSKIVLESPIRFELELIGEKQGYQLLSMTYVCQSHLSFLSRVVELDICEDYWLIVGESKKIMKPSLWLEFFRPFNSVRSLSVSETWEPLVGAALQELTGGRTLEVLPELQNLSLDELEPSGSARETMETFVALRRLSDRPIVAQRRKRHHPSHSSTCREWE